MISSTQKFFKDAQTSTTVKRGIKTRAIQVKSKMVDVETQTPVIYSQCLDCLELENKRAR